MVDGVAARRADALLALVTGHTGDGEVVERGTAEVVVHVDASTGAARLDNGPALAPASCPHTRYLNAHHIIPWEQGGPTDIDNLIMVCSFRHRVIHDHGYDIDRVGEKWEFRRPDGTPIPEVAPPLSGNAESLVEMHTRARLGIDHTTISPNWDGDSLDLDYVLWLLLPKRISTAARSGFRGTHSGERDPGGA